MNKKAYGQGRRAYEKQKPPSANPYHMATDAMTKNYREWHRGYDDARKQWVQSTNASWMRGS